VFFWLAFLAVPARATSDLGPLAIPIATPEGIRDRPVWCLQRLPSGELAVGIEGAVAIGVPGGRWTIAGSPNGGPVRVVSAAHDRLLVAGSGFCAFLIDGRLLPLAGMVGEYGAAEPVETGWLLTGSTGVWHAAPNGTSTVLMQATSETGEPNLLRRGGDVFITFPSRSPRRWTATELQKGADVGLPGNPRVYLGRGGLCFTSGGVFDESGQAVLSADVGNSLIDDAWINGAGRAGPWALFATFRKGLQAFEPGANNPAWTWTQPGSFYCFAADGDQFLFGTEHGAFALADPSVVRIHRLENAEIIHLRASPERVSLVTANGVLTLNSTEPDRHLYWPETDGAVAGNGELRFHSRSVALRTERVSGLAVCGETAAVASQTNLVLFNAGSTHAFTASSAINSLASDGRSFFIGTSADGVQVVSPDGRLQERLGSGRANVRHLNSGQLELLYWSGEVRDAQNNLIGQVPSGNPRDAALVDVRQPDGSVATSRLAVLASRTGKPPVVGLLDHTGWHPLEVPGLEEIDAETMAAAGDSLYLAGRRGVLQVHLPLAEANPPQPLVHWKAEPSGATVRLSGSAVDQAEITAGRWEPATNTPAVLKLRLPNGTWSDLVPGQAFAFSVPWGTSEIVVKAERHGLDTEQNFTVVRPYPWFLRWPGWVAAAVSLTTLVLGLARLRTRQLERQKRELEAQVSQRTEELRKANAVKEEFLASVSHEIRNPLNGVVGICAILQESEVGPREKNFVRVLAGCADQLRSMLDDILDFSRIAHGPLTVAASVFDLRSLVEEAARVMDPHLEDCALLLPEEPCWFVGDSGKIRQIVCNLVSNALKYGCPREAGVELRIEPEGLNRSRIRIAVRNTGPGIPAQELPRLFESFRRGSTAGGAPGTGLGLAICRRLAETMGGRMTAASTANTTEFAFELLLIHAHPPAPTASAPATVSRVLAVEDEDYNRLVLGHVLRSLGYSVDWAPDGASALRLAGRQQYDLILTDWRLPDFDGGELCRRLQAILPAPLPPIIAVTAYASSEKLDAARAAGMAGFVTKPVTREKLEQLIRNLASGMNPRRSLDVTRMPAAVSPLAELGDLAPSVEQLSADIETGWNQTEAMARLHDPRTGRAAHGLRSLVLLAGEGDTAEQLGLLEDAADRDDWPTVGQLLPFLIEEIGGVRDRLKLK